MKTFDSYRLHITPLSPIHIGTGESYEPTNYVIDDGILHEFDTGATVAAWSASERKALLDIASRKPDADMIQALQRFFYERRETLMAHAIQQAPVLPGVAALYARRIGQIANLEAGSKKGLEEALHHLLRRAHFVVARCLLRPLASTRCVMQRFLNPATLARKLAKPQNPLFCR
ncbi:MAG: hypothetical protein ACK4XK_08890 [Casimicrobiaceae bacterium]